MTQEQGPVMISVVIPARNEEEFLPATVEALKAQSYRNFEVIVVANGCNDRTADVARELGCRVFELGDRGLGAARNLGGRAAQGQILVFLDADTLLPKDTLKTVGATFDRRAACGPVCGEAGRRVVAYKLMRDAGPPVGEVELDRANGGAILRLLGHALNVGGFD